MTLTIEQQTRQLDALRQFLELIGVVECQRGGVLQGVHVPMLVKTAYQTYAVGTYPVQQERGARKAPFRCVASQTGTNVQ